MLEVEHRKAALGRLRVRTVASAACVAAGDERHWVSSRRLKSWTGSRDSAFESGRPEPVGFGKGNSECGVVEPYVLLAGSGRSGPLLKIQQGVDPSASMRHAVPEERRLVVQVRQRIKPNIV